MQENDKFQEVHRGRRGTEGTWGHLLLVFMLTAPGMHPYLEKSRELRTDQVLLGIGIQDMLMDNLGMKDLSPRIAEAVPMNSATMVYVLGSTQDRLKHHFRTAANLYRTGVCDRIFILSRPGITEYSTKLLRNLTNDEWSVRELKVLGVPADDVEAVQVPSGFFGTYAEGRRISRFAQEKGFERMVLVSSPHHARRVCLTFSHFLGESIEVYFEGSGDPVGMAELLVEYGKYLWYSRVLIPVDRILARAQKGAAKSKNGFPENWNATEHFEAQHSTFVVQVKDRNRYPMIANL